MYLTSGATLIGFTLTNGCAHGFSVPEFASDGDGGGVWCVSAGALVSNCVLTGNLAYKNGGGACGGTLNNCVLGGNSATSGGGAYSSALNNCTVSGNSATYGGGTYSGTSRNTIICSNSAPNGANYSGGTFTYCCTSPLTDGVGNIGNDPLLVDFAGGNLHLQASSPCINSGYDPYAPAGPDLDGNPRIVGGTVDIGAYEFQSPQSVISYAWLQQHGLATNGTADSVDTDGDGLNNWQEWRSWTDPTDARSVLQMLLPTNDVSGVIIAWQSVTNRTYWLERATDLAAQPIFLTLATNIAGWAGVTIYTDTNAVADGPSFYRVGVQR